MGIRLLGPVELANPAGLPVMLPGAQRRAVLALLALRLGRVVAVDQFFELLWGEEPPAQARAALQGHVAALRKLLAEGPFVLHTRAPGYLLTGPADQVDALRFAELVARAQERAERPAQDQDSEAIAELEQALGLWRSPALSDLPDTELRRAVAGRLTEDRTKALINWAELRLRQGIGATAVPALQLGVRADGLREELVALLIRCLHQAGRPSDALTAYHQARTLLDRELGLRPGAELRAALAEVLAERPPGTAPAGATAAGRAPARTAAASTTAAAVEPSRAATEPGTPERGTTLLTPRQLPRPPAGFVGRGEESCWLDRECGPHRDGDGLALVVGPAGVGKSATVVRWAHRVSAAFPDGQLFADLRGFDPAGPADPFEVLGHFLLALGVPEAALPADRSGRAALYRARTGDLRLLVLLDNAGSADQVADLLPGGPDCATAITSRRTLEDLMVTESAALLRLEPLPHGDALRLLERALTTERVRAEPAAAGQLIELCDQLPLALRIALSRLAARPDWTIATLVGELADERTRLPALEASGATGVRAALMLTYRQLGSAAAELLTFLAVHPGREVDALTAVALLGADDTGAARAALGELATHHLLAESTPGRYHRPELVRLFSVELLAERPPAVQRRCTEQLLDHYLAAARHCGEQVNPGQDRRSGPTRPPGSLPPADARAALDWFRAEEPTIRLLLDTAAATDPERIWRLALAAGTLFYASGRLTEWLDCSRAGERAARLCGNRLGTALLRGAQGNALLCLQRPQEAAEAAGRAVADTTPADGVAHSRALAVLATAYATLGDTAEARRLIDAATELSESSGDPRELRHILSHSAAISLVTGDFAAALRLARTTRALLPERPATTITTWLMLTEAQALQGLGHTAAAALAWPRLLASCREAESPELYAIAERCYLAFQQGLRGAPGEAARPRPATVPQQQPRRPAEGPADRQQPLLS
ncbi:AfsR/SARP family transcriptional regulator [Kitasatospora sp. NBC_01266]|uniref:AfsR/SARP family transcriptional regulator n=1 Tax=Kitasatospora sp. NBC_01266 TaxID=2903572 RepID=UPI002E30411B|nr:BTAD domain-containing putative transcriptional regulator [Kitasatospora sp. NBC_01266]